MRKRIAYRAFLEVVDDDGEHGFYDTNKILQSPELQARCVEKAVLRRIINRLQKHVFGENHARFDT
jgi:hypothetical protein